MNLDKIYNLKKKVFVVTGGSGFIGTNLIKNLNGFGSITICIDINSPKNKKNCFFYQCDITNEKDVKINIKNIIKKFKKIDVLINNAGLALGLSGIENGNMDDWDTMIDTNVKGLLYVTRMIAPLMKERMQGHIFNIGSVAGKDTYKNGNVYCATKHAVDSLTKATRIDLLPYHIKVTGICPGAAETEFSLVRYKGDEQKAKDVYKGFSPLLAEDISEIIWFAATRPAHVCLNDIVVTPTVQANAFYMEKKQ